MEARRTSGVVSKNSEDQPVLLGYWAIRGLGNSIRHLLHYAGIPHTEKTYPFGARGQENRRSEWLADKPRLGLDFPNLPYLVDGELKLTQSLAILRYLARRSGLFPAKEREQTLADVAEQQLNDLMWENVRLCYNPDYDESKRDAFLERFLGDRLPALARFLADRQFLTGDAPSYVDFLAFEALDQHRTLWPKECSFQDQPKILAYLRRIESLPAFRDYLASEAFVSWPVWSEMSSFGGPDTARPPARD
ncbi:unnamed protein product [Ixodes hexagonus]